MKRLLTIVEGEGQGRTMPLAPGLMIVGRSSDADFKVEDLKVSRGHLQVRVEADAIFVKNLSARGSSLNGKPLTGDISLNAGDLLTVGHTKLRYDEVLEAATNAGGTVCTNEKPTEANVQRSGSAETLASPATRAKEDSPEQDGTRVAPNVPVGAGLRGEGGEEPEDGTKAYGGQVTMVQAPGGLPVPPRPREPGSSASVWGILVIVLVLAVLGGYWFVVVDKGNRGSTTSLETYGPDPQFDFSIQYPTGWLRSTDKPGLIAFAFGAESDAAWARVNIYPDRDEKHAVTGLTDGFIQYEENLKKRFAGFELAGKQRMELNGATVWFFGFGTPTLQGKGIYLLDAEKRIVAECFSPRACYPQYAKVFSSILQSFRLSHLREGEAQQFIDFPMPDGALQQLALSNPAELSRQVETRIRAGEALVANRDVRPDNLYRAVQEYRRALQLAIAGPERLASYGTAAQGLLQTTKLFNQALERQRFEINRARKEGDDRAAYWEANKMMQMVPDKTDPAYQEAYKVAQKLRNPNREQ